MGERSRSCSSPLSSPCLGTWEGAAGPGRRRGSRALGRGHVHLPRKDILSPCQVLPERHPSPGPGGHLAGTRSARSRREPGGGAPRTLTLLFSSALPLSSEPRKNQRLEGRREGES